MEVKFIDKMGTDLSVVNAARVSFSKTSDWVYEVVEEVDADSRTLMSYKMPKDLQDKDKKLINFLAKNNHWTPFAHTSITLHLKVPIFVARQLHKHQVGGVVNEVSRRYIDSEPEFYFPENWRKRNEDKKQGSHEDQFVEKIEVNSVPWYPSPWHPTAAAKLYCNNMLLLYKDMLKTGVCPEQARMLLPQNMYTEFYWTGSLVFFARVFGLRAKPDAQLETRHVANLIDHICAKHFPISWAALTNK